MNYIKEIFDPVNEQHAKDICLSPDRNDPKKFQRETDFLIKFLHDNGYATPEKDIADFGCGVGRVSKQLIEQLKCKVVGFDISKKMIHAAINYIENDDFDFYHYGVNVENKCKIKFDTVIASLVLQHSEHPIYDINFIDSIMKPNGVLVLVNEKERYVPTEIVDGAVKWHDDGIVIVDEVSKVFDLVGEYNYYTRPDKCLTVWRKR
jgi:2-polyprenyl-3-methyl-5-hydroxy-6-metoxy-1,4-benzoquinol methylase